MRDDSTVIGVVEFIIKQEILSSIVGNITLGENGNAYMIDKNGYTIADSDVQLVIDKANIPEQAKSNLDCVEKVRVGMVEYMHRNSERKETEFYAKQ